MSSFSLWFNSDISDISDLNAEVHFNLWNLHYNKAMPPCLDIGIKIHNSAECSEVNFYIPFKISITEIQDLGKTLKSSDILCSVFNEDYISSHQSGQKVIKVNDCHSKEIMNIYCLDIANDIDLQFKYNGTLISITYPQILKSEELPSYFRLRLQSKEFSHIIKCYNPKNIFFQSAVSTLEAVDFRFNDYRSLDVSLLEYMRKGVSYNLNKVHFLLLMEADVELQYSSLSTTARELENKIWTGYYNNLQNKNIVAYHWKFLNGTENKLIENCIMFVKVKVHKCNWKTIIIYIISLGFITVLFNYISYLLF